MLGSGGQYQGKMDEIMVIWTSLINVDGPWGRMSGPKRQNSTETSSSFSFPRPKVAVEGPSNPGNIKPVR